MAKFDGKPIPLPPRARGTASRRPWPEGLRRNLAWVALAGLAFGVLALKSAATPESRRPRAAGALGGAPVCAPLLSENFDDISTLAASGWVMTNNSQPAGTDTWYQGDDTVFSAETGATDAYIAADYNSGGSPSTISNWLILPNLTMQNGDVLKFFTRTVAAPEFPDRLEVRMSTNGSSADVGASETSVGDFTTLLLTINPTLTTTGYPTDWTEFTVTISGLSGATSGRLAFRYFVTDAGPDGTNSDYIGIDTVTYESGCPTPTPTATPPSCPPTIAEAFNDVTTLASAGWVQTNKSQPLGTQNWFQGDDTVFPAQSGSPNAYAAVNFNSGGAGATISNWLILPNVTMQNGDVLSFYTRTVSSPSFPDRLEVRMSTNGSSADVGADATTVGDFSTLLLTINPSLTTSGYPSSWTLFTVTITGLPVPTSGRLAFRYFVTDAGPGGTNSDYIGIDTVTYQSVCPPSGALSLFTVAPCRAVDTRAADGPALAGGSDRPFTISGKCGVPAAAKAVSINVTVTQPTASGDLRLYPATLPLVSTINFKAGQTRANNAVAGLSGTGQFTVRTDMAAGKTVHFIVDVNGYFQ